MKANNKLILKILLLVIIILAIFGYCKVEYVRQNDLYFQNNHDLASNYSMFAITSIEDIRSTIFSESSVKRSILSIIRRNIKDNLRFKQFLNKLIEIENDNDLKKLDKLEIINNGLIRGDELYRYIFKNSEYIEEGIIILNEGKVRLKYIDNTKYFNQIIK